MIGKVGLDSYGDGLLESLQHAGVQTDGINREDVTGLAFISVAEDGENNIVLVPGANALLGKNDIDEMVHYIRESDLMIMQLEIPLDVVEYVLEIAARLNKKVILNPAPASKLPGDLLQHVHTLIPNEIELGMLTGLPISTDKEVIIASKELLGLGMKRVLVTLGEKGSILVSEKEQVKIPAYCVTAVDSTAAGDSYIGAFAVGILKGMAEVEAANFASKVAAVVVTCEGAQTSMPTMDELEHIQFEELW